MTDGELAAAGYTSTTLEESRAHAKIPEFAATREEHIDYSEIPPVSDRRLTAMVRADCKVVP